MTAAPAPDAPLTDGALCEGPHAPGVALAVRETFIRLRAGRPPEERRYCLLCALAARAAGPLGKEDA